MFFSASLAFGLIACEENGDGVQRGIGEIAKPVVWVVRPGDAKYLCSRSHTLFELVRKGGQGCFIEAERAKAVPGEGNSHPASVR